MRTQLLKIDKSLHQSIVRRDGLDVFIPFLCTKDGSRDFKLDTLTNTLIPVEKTSCDGIRSLVWQPFKDFIQESIITLIPAECYCGYLCFVVLKSLDDTTSDRFGSLFVDTPYNEEWVSAFPKYICDAIPPSALFLTQSETKYERILFLINLSKSTQSFSSFSKQVGVDAQFSFSVDLDEINFDDLACKHLASSWAFDRGKSSLCAPFDKLNQEQLRQFYRYLEFTYKTICLYDLKRVHSNKGFCLLFVLSNGQNPRTGMLIPFFPNARFLEDPCNNDLIEEIGKNVRLCGSCIEPYIREIEGMERSRKEVERLRYAHTKSAIASIMSRNGSHNIGSHVLSALSHNVGTMPDDRVLYQYIQHRMDYIANVTADIPTWTQPTMLVGELMRGFYSQRHLLEHIAESEGLSAWEFQNPNLTETAAKNQHAKIRLLLRRKDEKGTFVPVIDYDKANGGVDLSRDVALAVPGGVVGNHAFYTILENVIRNAAKHGWSTKRPQDREQSNLEVVIDFEDKGGEVVFTVWDNQSNDDAVKEKSGKSLVERQTERVSQKFIADDGRLRRENWGMAEIKISAGYLMSRGIDEIGGLVKGATPIVTPCPVKDEDENGCVHRLGYRFSIRKPTDVVFVVGDSQRALWDMLGESRLNSLARQGIEFVEWDKVADDQNQFAARHVVLPRFGNEERVHGILPFRVLAWQGGENASPELVPELDMAKVVEALREPDARLAETLRRIVATAWLGHLRSHSNDEKVKNAGLALVVNTSGNNSNAGRGLITDDDILSFVFEHGLRTAIETFVETRGGTLPKDLQDILLMLHAIYPEKGGFEKHPEVEDVRAKIAWALLSRLQAVEDTYAACLIDPAADPAAEQSVRAELGESRKRLHFNDDPQLEQSADAKDYLKHNFGRPPHQKSEDRKKHSERRKWWKKNPHPIRDFVLHLRSVFKETDVFLRKYEERLVTLPAGFSSSGNDVKSSVSASVDWFGFVDYLPQKPDSSFAKAVANYTRHDQPGKERAAGVVYHEPLSGTQSYLNSLIQLSIKGPELMAGSDVLLEKLSENALLKICIADERMSKFLRDHQTLGNTYNAENILVLDEKWMESCLNREKDPDGCENLGSRDSETGLWRPPAGILRRIRDYVRSHGLLAPEELDGTWVAGQIKSWKAPPTTDEFWQRGKVFDILVLHQGLIDKWLGEAAHSKAHVAVFLELLKQHVKYVVITTGRGTPANIPPGARVLPFPTLESTLFKMYPEKMILVDTILNILPAHGGETKGANK